MYHHNIMRTTVNIDDPVLKDLKRLQKRERKSLGRLVSDLLADSLARRGEPSKPPAPLAWISRPMESLVNLEDREALLDLLDRTE